MNTYTDFQSFIWQFYRDHGRSFAWRNTENPYYILVSEVMLQQTQTYRVEPKYEQFIAELPTIESLAHASLCTVLSLWQGLGYNRRGKYLHELAKQIVTEHNGIIPDIPEKLIQLPGIGKNTAASICAFAFNKPTIFIETNIRAVYIHSFFAGSDQVDDKELLPFITQTVDHTNPREWYYALMDYGVYLKKQCVNPSRASKHYTKQSKFEGSDRQIRGAIIRLLTKQTDIEKSDLFSSINAPEQRIQPIFDTLISEGFIVVEKGITKIK
jgi:A/G-specific adenine glycosylase